MNIFIGKLTHILDQHFDNKFHSITQLSIPVNDDNKTLASTSYPYNNCNNGGSYSLLFNEKLIFQAARIWTVTSGRFTSQTDNHTIRGFNWVWFTAFVGANFAGAPLTQPNSQLPNGNIRTKRHRFAHCRFAQLADATKLAQPTDADVSRRFRVVQCICF